MKNDAKIIGVTGNIATGKSVLRRMLVNSGALGIDADELAHRMIYTQGLAFKVVVKTFGEKILSEDGSISHGKLGQIVFNDPEALIKLEKLVHPFVIEAIHTRVDQSCCSLVVIEAIKLLEAGLGDICDAIWVSHASSDLQLERLMHIRNMTCHEAKLRISSQPLQDEKITRADVVINTEGSFYSTWQHVQRALNDTIHLDTNAEPQNLNSFTEWTFQSARETPQVQLEAFWHTHTEKDSSNLYEHLGSHMLLPLYFEGQLTAIVIWENWNFTATLKSIIPASLFGSSSTVIFEAFQEDARVKQSEILLLSEELAHKFGLQTSTAGFENYHIDQLVYPAWHQAANKITTDRDIHLWVKKLSDPLENRNQFCKFD
ncbi:MAG: dephospho-CoA kinase [Chloroflexota bacterium]|nr:dephospho-CoA kinase [Chloroflexota bacterium]